MAELARPSYHWRALDLISEQPVVSETAVKEIDLFEQTTGHKLPLAIREWLTLDADAQLFHKITQFPHDFIRPSELASYMSIQRFDGADINALTIIFENQGCFVMAIDIAEGDNPKVWISRDIYDSESAIPTWLLHSNRFSECIEAFAWDYAVITETGTSGFETYPESLEQESITETGPTTFNTASWFYGDEFRRMIVNGRRRTLFA